jgi:hypothetical protein
MEQTCLSKRGGTIHAHYVYSSTTATQEDARATTTPSRPTDCSYYCTDCSVRLE